jgi:hypothetical protein
MTGKGWLLVGDSAGFVDPILSSGVLLAHQNGQKAAYTIRTVLGSGSPEWNDRYWRFYEDTYRQMLQAYRQMASYWYSNNYAQESWWWEAWRQIAQANQANPLTDRDSFMRLASGYANRTESTSLFGSYTAAEAYHLADYLFTGDAAPNGRTRNLPESARLGLGAAADLTTGFIFHGGRIQHTTRVRNPATDAYIDLFPGETELVKRLAEGCSVDVVRQPSPHRPIRTPQQLLDQLDQLGVLAVTS